MTDRTGTEAEVLSLDALQAVVELQRTELTRLLREQGRLNDRIDSLLRLNEREQVLRQQMQASLDRLAAAQIASVRPGGVHGAALPHTPPPANADVVALQTRLELTETRFSALQEALGALVTHIERHMPSSGIDRDGAGFVRVYAPG